MTAGRRSAVSSSTSNAACQIARAPPTASLATTPRPFAAVNLRLATLVQDDVLDAMDAQGWQIPDRGVQPDTQLGSISDTS